MNQGNHTCHDKLSCAFVVVGRGLTALFGEEALYGRSA